MIGTMIDGTSNGSGSRGMSEVSKTKGCTLPEGDNEYGGDGDVSGEQESVGFGRGREDCLTAGPEKNRQGCRAAGPEAGWKWNYWKRSRLEAEARG
jgi:hypothetical protein